MLTKKDFKVIAEIVEDNTTEIDGDCLVYNHYQVIARNALVEELADYFATQNSRFDRQKYLNACGLQD